AGVPQRIAGCGLRHLPDLARVVLDPAGPREMLGELAVGPADRLCLLVEDEASRAGGALVDREDHRDAPNVRIILMREPSASPARGRLGSAVVHLYVISAGIPELSEDRLASDLAWLGPQRRLPPGTSRIG